MFPIKAEMVIPVTKVPKRKSQDHTHNWLLPKVSMDQAERSYFIWQGKAYSVKSAPLDIFKGALQLTQLPKTDDIVSRWYLLNQVHDAGHPLKLYSSRKQAERAL